MNDIDLRILFADRKMSAVGQETGIQYDALMRWFRGNDRAISAMHKEELKVYLQKHFHQLKKYL